MRTCQIKSNECFGRSSAYYKSDLEFVKTWGPLLRQAGYRSPPSPQGITLVTTVHFERCEAIVPSADIVPISINLCPCVWLQFLTEQGPRSPGQGHYKTPLFFYFKFLTTADLLFGFINQLSTNPSVKDLVTGANFKHSSTDFNQRHSSKFLRNAKCALISRAQFRKW